MHSNRLLMTVLVACTGGANGQEHGLRSRVCMLFVRSQMDGRQESESCRSRGVIELCIYTNIDVKYIFKASTNGFLFFSFSILNFGGQDENIGGNVSQIIFHE